MSYNTFTPIVTNGLVLYLDAANTKSYPGTGTSWLDLSKNGNTGTIFGSTFSNSVSGNFIFNGSTDYVLTTNVFNPSNWSVSLWINPSMPLSSNPPYYGLYTLVEGNSTTQLLGMYDSYLTMYTTIIVNYSFVNNPGWHYVTFTYDGTRMYGYVDDVSSGSTLVSNPLSTSKVRRIGKRDSVDTVHPFKGNIAIVQFYNRLLSTSEVLQNYNATKYRYIG